jgi:hypothetical protein
MIKSLNTVFVIGSAMVYNVDVEREWGELVFPKIVTINDTVHEITNKVKGNKTTHFKFDTKAGRMDWNQLQPFAFVDDKIAMRAYMHRITIAGYKIRFTDKERVRWLEQKKDCLNYPMPPEPKL